MVMHLPVLKATQNLVLGLAMAGLPTEFFQAFALGVLRDWICKKGCDVWDSTLTCA